MDIDRNAFLVVSFASLVHTTPKYTSSVDQGLITENRIWIFLMGEPLINYYLGPLCSGLIAPIKRGTRPLLYYILQVRMYPRYQRTTQPS